MRSFTAAFALAVLVLIVPAGRSAEPDAVRVAAAKAAWKWVELPPSPPDAIRVTAATQAAAAAWRWVDAPPCECGGTSPSCPCRAAEVAAPIAPAPKGGVCDCGCTGGKACQCVDKCPAILSSYAEASAAAVAAQRRLVVFIGPVASRSVPGCVVCRVHTLEGDGRARVMVGVPGRPDRQLGRVDLPATATDAEILAVGLPAPIRAEPAPAVMRAAAPR